MSVLWGENKTHEAAWALNACGQADRRLLPFDIAGSVAHVSMLKECLILGKDEAQRLLEGLLAIEEEMKNEQSPLWQRFDEAEDVHSFVEMRLVELVGEVGKKLHTARSRNDQIALDLRLYFASASDAFSSLLKELIKALIELAKSQQDSIMPGYTHLQRAQPISFAHFLLAHASAFSKDITRLKSTKASSMSFSPLGAGALAGTSLPIKPSISAKLLGFREPFINSIDAVSSRDYLLDYTHALSLIALNLSRLAEEIILYSSSEFGFIKPSPAFSTGSSIMPQKKNPDIAELLRAKSAVIINQHPAALNLLKALPFAYNKDLQELKLLAFDMEDRLKLCLSAAAPMIKELLVFPENMRQACVEGHLNATDLADYLAKKGLAFREAYLITANIVSFCDKQGFALSELTLERLKKFSALFEADVYEAIKPENCLKRRAHPGAAGALAEQFEYFEGFLSS